MYLIFKNMFMNFVEVDCNFTKFIRIYISRRGICLNSKIFKATTIEFTFSISIFELSLTLFQEKNGGIP